MSNVVTRVYKNTGKFEGIKGIETGPEDHFDELLTPVSLSSDNLTLNIGQYSCTLFDSNFESAPWNSNMEGVSTIYFGDYSKLDTITSDYLFSVSTSNFTVTKGPSWNDSSINGFDLIYTSSPGTNCSEIHVSSTNDGCTFVSEDAQTFAATTSMSLPYATRITKHSHSISRQGECTFSEIVETGRSVNPSINKNTGVLTCNEFIEGDYSTTVKYLDGFSGSVLGSKITCNNGYLFDLFSDSSGSTRVSFGNLFSSSLVVIVGYKDPSDSSGYSIVGTLDSSKDLIFDTTYNSSTGNPNWADSQKLYIDNISFSNAISSILYIRITDPEGNSVYYGNSSSKYQYFYPIDNDNQLWIPSKYRYQNYLI